MSGQHLADPGASGSGPIDPASIRLLGPAELDGWDAATVDVPGGHVYQSRAWGEYRARHGWRPWFLAFADGARVLALSRPWAWVGGAGAYISRGPVAAGERPERTAARTVAVSRWLATRGVDVVATDAEIPAATGYAGLLQAAGFHPIDEIQPSRHRMALPLAPGITDDALFAGLETRTRRKVRGAEKAGLRSIRYDVLAGRGPALPDLALPDAPVEDAAADALDRLYDLLVGVGRRRGFRVGARDSFADWGMTGLRAGSIVLLEIAAPDGTVLGAAMFYRHGGRLTYSHSGDRDDLRSTYPGVAHLLIWRAIQLARATGLGEMDLGGVDVRGARELPRPGEEMYGLYEFKHSYGAEWVEQAGNLEWVARPWRYALGRAADGLAARVGRR